MDDPQDLVSVYKAENPTEAHFVMNLMLDEDIDAQVSEENEPFAGLPIVSPDVLVRKADEVRAREVVAAYQRDLIERSQRPDWICPECGAMVVGAFDECDNCGTDRAGEEAE
jgi:hypothetical protein